MRKHKSFLKHDYSLGFEETDWVSQELIKMLGPDYAFEQIAKYYNFVDKVVVREFIAFNSAGQEVCIKFEGYEDPECY